MDGDKATMRVCTSQYRPPENFPSGEPYNEADKGLKLDSWAMGCVLAELAQVYACWEVQRWVDSLKGLLPGSTADDRDELARKFAAKLPRLVWRQYSVSKSAKELCDERLEFVIKKKAEADTPCAPDAGACAACHKCWSFVAAPAVVALREAMDAREPVWCSVVSSQLAGHLRAKNGRTNGFLFPGKEENKVVEIEKTLAQLNTSSPLGGGGGGGGGAAAVAAGPQMEPLTRWQKRFIGAPDGLLEIMRGLLDLNPKMRWSVSACL
jgi:serine/threonine protein kinase